MNYPKSIAALRKCFFFLFFSFLSISVFQSCSKNDDDNPDGPGAGDKMKFIAAYNPSNGQVLGEDFATALLSVEDGAIQYGTLTTYYAESNNLWTYGDMGIGGFAMGLHDDFNGLNEGFHRTAHGLYYHFETGSSYLLPLLPVGQDDDYPYFVAASVKMSKSGHVFYLSATNDRYYGDQYRASLVRYNTATQILDVAVSPVNFALSQPELGNDTETAQFKGNYFVSGDGRFVYGVLETFGVSGGALHWDYEILFQYDFETSTYKRLGIAGDDDPTLLGVTSDGAYIAYWDKAYKIQNLSTETVNEISVGSTRFHPPLQWNQNGYCEGATTGIYYTDLLNNTSYMVVDKYGVKSAQFADNGTQLIFYLEDSDANYLCKTVDLTENTTWDTIAGFPSSFNHLLLVK